jgi:alanine racemase
MMAVVKADAYGHGAPFVAKEFDALGADYFGVSNIEEALQLRRCGISKPILILGYTPPEYADVLIEKKISQTVFSLDYAKELSAAAVKSGGKITAHIKIDTGMSRIGFLFHNECESKESLDEITKAAALQGLDLEGAFTHFAVADEPDNEFTHTQFNRFIDALSALESRNVKFRLRHCCNSAGLLNFPEMQLDMVRPGIILYGLTPCAGMPMPIELKPVMSLKTAISQVKELDKDTAISYGMTYRTQNKSVIATLPIGYADGYARSLSNSAEVLIKGKRASVVGRVCMDQSMADITAIDGATVSDIATIIGSDGGEQVTMEEIASKMGTINYETACLIGKRVPRVFLKNGGLVGQQNYYCED